MTSHQVVILLFDLTIILALAHAFGGLAVRLGQPAVIGEMIAGILAGPSLFHGAISRTLFPVGTRPSLDAMANIGIALFMFAVGLELDRTLIRGYGRVTGIVSTGSMLVPCGLGAALALLLADRYAVPERLGFVLFMGVAMSITAFPVLARILTDRAMLRTTLGGLALACAAAGDVLAWSLLAAVVAVIGSGGRNHLLILGVVPYVLVMLTVVRPLLARLLAARPSSGTAGARERSWRPAVVLVGLLASAGVTEWLGLHFIFGAFLFGVVMPRHSAGRVLQETGAGAGRLVNVLMLPVFFVVAGMKVDLSGMSAADLADLALILLVAIVGKFLGTFLAARLCGVRPRHSAALAVLMNTRGLTELVVLSVGLQLGVLPPRLYSIMVVMAIITTAMAGPLLAFVYPRRLVENDVSAVRPASPASAAYPRR
jgi:Kef-type K+ transport system membrane component KefB